MHTILSPLTTFGGKFLLYTYLVGERYFTGVNLNCIIPANSRQYKTRSSSN